MPQSPRQRRTALLKKFATDLGKIENQQQQNFIRLHETLNNLAVVSGGVAVGALVLLSSQTDLYAPFILTGVVALFVELPFYFIFKIRAHLKIQDLFIEVNRKVAAPVKNIAELAEDDSLSDGDFLNQADTTMSDITTWFGANKSKLDIGNRKLHWPEAVCYLLFVFGLFMIALGLLQPYSHTILFFWP